MKNRPYIIVCGWLLLFCSSLFAQKYPTPADNPWEDDYRDSSAMEHYKSWGTYNVHDPSCKKIGDTYYMFSTDAIYRENKAEAKRLNIPMGYIQVRSSKDLVHWTFLGWAFPEIPHEAKEWVLSHSDNEGATNIWAPYIIRFKDRFRLYYCVSAFGQQNSYIGMAESDSVNGPWIQKGCVVKTHRGDKMNAIDPSVITDTISGRMWMHYGSYFGGLFAVELNPETGLALTSNDQGHLIARRANLRHDNLEAPEIVYNPIFQKYFLFVSYDPLMTTYNLRVGRSDKPEGPFLDFFGNDLRDTINHFPILTYPYQFQNHPGWAGVGHCTVFDDGHGHYFLGHQGRLSPDNHLMDLHVRELKWTKDGWPVVSPERYSDTSTSNFLASEIVGSWEIIKIDPSRERRDLEAGQILWGQNRLRAHEINISSRISILANGIINGERKGKWHFSNHHLTLKFNNEMISDLIVFVGHDWENKTETLLFTGLDKSGCSIWGKLIK